MSDTRRNRDNYLSDPRETEELFAIAMHDVDSDEASDAIITLRYRASRDVLQESISLCQSQNSDYRILGVRILGHLGFEDRPFLDERGAQLIDMLEDEGNTNVISEIGVALGHMSYARGIPPLVRHMHHVDSDVRHAVVFGLLSHEDSQAIATLIELMNDEDDEVCDWATFGIGSLVETDTPQIREALLKNTNHSNEMVQFEAIVGLANRRDPRAVDLMIRDFSQCDPSVQYLEAAEEMADERLFPHVLRLREVDPDDEAYQEAVERALEKCRPKDSIE